MKFLFAFLFLVSVAAAAKDEQQVVLAVGATQSIHFSNSRTVKATDLGSHVRISGKAVGEVDLEYQDGTYHVEVVKPDEFRLYLKFEKLVSQMRGLKLKVHKGRLQVTGELLRKSDWIKLSQNNLDGIGFEFHAALDSHMKHEMLVYFHEVLKTSDLPITSLQLVPTAQVSLTKSMLSLKSKYERALASYGFVVEQNSSILQLEPLVRVNILVAEIRKNFSRTLGVAFPSSSTSTARCRCARGC